MRERFRSVECDEYYLMVTPPDGYTFTTPNQSDDPETNSAVDEDGRSPNFTLDPPSQDSPPKAGHIPVTGTSIAITLAVALMALAVGGGLWFLGRRRGSQARMTGSGSDH